MNTDTLKQLYQSDLLRSEGLNDRHQEKLESELQNVLKRQLQRVEDDLRRKKVEEAKIQEDLEMELSESLREQFSSVLQSLEPQSQEELERKMKKMTRKEIQDSLEAQLRGLFDIPAGEAVL